MKKKSEKANIFNPTSFSPLYSFASSLSLFLPFIPRFKRPKQRCVHKKGTRLNIPSQEQRNLGRQSRHSCMLARLFTVNATENFFCFPWATMEIVQSVG
ncbi:hypothetical protein CEXT_76671 [Caerostris extrusa]|uniref:Uncharacterized protein n=1 Tax=Caerostris extrusa TaxID=172846 RepID=A0AAV4N3F2_CAEEX|nr:hypothetical protein CEXT_76671 [Caerostris extrusa]